MASCCSTLLSPTSCVFQDPIFPRDLFHCSPPLACLSYGTSPGYWLSLCWFNFAIRAQTLHRDKRRHSVGIKGSRAVWCGIPAGIGRDLALMSWREPRKTWGLWAAGPQTSGLRWYSPLPFLSFPITPPFRSVPVCAAECEMKVTFEVAIKGEVHMCCDWCQIQTQMHTEHETPELWMTCLRFDSSLIIYI